MKALRAIPDSARGWQTETRSVKCQSCQAISVFNPERVAQTCDFCGSPVARPLRRNQGAHPPGERPAVPGRGARCASRSGWYAAGGLRPIFKSRAFIDTIHGLYLPYWTFDAQVVCPWNAEAGYYYYTTETYRDTKGNRQTRQVQHVRWVPASGEVDHFFDDEPIPGTQGVAHALLKQVEPFPTEELRPYDTAFLSGFVVEHYQVVLIDAAKRSQEAMDQKLYAMCSAQVPGDTQRNLQIHPTYSGQTFKHILVPVWLLTYDFASKAYQVVVNGVTGRMAGDYPKSFWKIALLVLAAVIVVIIIALLSQE